jgi:N-carbamoylputrescine amidase
MSLRKREEIQEVLRGLAKPDGNYVNKSPVKVAGIQFSATGDRDHNVARAMRFAEIALDKGSKIICFSELFALPWLKLDDDSYFDLAEKIPGPSTEPFYRLASESDSIIMCPIYERCGDKLFDSVVIIGKEGVCGIYRKNQIPNVPFWEESRFFVPGDGGFPVFDTPFGKIGIQIGWDVFFPEGFRMLAMKGAEIVFAPTAAALDSQFRWVTVLRANAIFNNVFAFRINRVGSEGDIKFYGKSFCIDPFGEFAAKPVFHRDAIVIVEIDRDAVRLARNEFPFLEERRKELYSELTDGIKKTGI